MKIFLACGPTPVQPRSLLTYKDADIKPNVLISFHYLKNFKNQYHPDKFKGYNLMLDSGAYSAYNAGKTIDIEQLIEETKNPRWVLTVALDVIGDGRKSLENALYMKSKGSPAFPVFHIGDERDILETYCKEFEFVGLSCRFGETISDSLAWLDNCFNRHWPHKFHSFGWVQEDMLMRFPFYSADASSWAVAPMAYGKWSKSLGDCSVRKPSSRGVNLRPEINGYLRMEQKLKRRWRKVWENQKWQPSTSEDNTTSQQLSLI